MPALVVLAGTWVNSHDEAVMQDQVDNVSSGHEFLQLMMQSLRMSMPSAGVLTIQAAHHLTLTKTPRSCIKALLPESHSVQMHCPPHSEPIHGTPMNVTAMLVGPGSMLLYAAQHHLSEQGDHLRFDAFSLVADALLSKRYVLQLGANRRQLPSVIAQRLVNMVGMTVKVPRAPDTRDVSIDRHCEEDGSTKRYKSSFGCPQVKELQPPVRWFEELGKSYAYEQLLDRYADENKPFSSGEVLLRDVQVTDESK